MTTRRLFAPLLALFLGLPGSWNAASADEVLRLAVQPMFDDISDRVDYHALVEYLSRHTERRIEIVHARDILAFWRNLRSHQYDVVIGAAPLLASPIRDGALVGVAQSEAVRTYQLAIRRDAGIDDVADFAAKGELSNAGVAGQGAPGTASMGFSQLFPNVMRQPRYRVVDSAGEALESLRRREVAGVILPRERIAGQSGLKVLATSEVTLVPVVAVDASLAPETREQVRRTFLDIGRHADGLLALDDAFLGGFRELDDNDVNAAAVLLERYWYY